MQAADWKCQQCGDERTTLHVHHPEYRRGAKPWEYEAGELECLCSHCHKREHGERPPSGSRSLARLLWEEIGRYQILAISNAMLYPEEWTAEQVDAEARRQCAAEGVDYDALASEYEAEFAASAGAVR